MPYTDLDDKLPDFIVAKLANDPTFRHLTGGSGVAGDPRIYWYYNADALLSGEKPAYVSYAQLSSPRERGGVREPVYSFRVYAFDPERAFDVEKRLNDLLDRVVHAFDSQSTKLTSERIHAQDLFDQNNKFAGREVHYAFGVLATAR